MLLFYYDEVKYAPRTQQYYWLGGIGCHCDHVAEIEAQVNKVAIKAFNSSTLIRKNEFHGIDICSGKANFKNVDLQDRLEILKDLLKIIANKHIHRGYIRIIPANFVLDLNPSEKAFMYLIEKVDKLFIEQNTVGMLFGDYDEPQVEVSVESLSNYRKDGTEWAKGKSINNIIDTVHFAKSHHSRLIQLADIYIYCLQFMHHKNTSNARSQIAKIIEDSGILQANFRKVWPNSPTWYR